MSTRYSVRRLLVALAVSQALALQALLLSWGGALAVAGEFTRGLGLICASQSGSQGAGGTESQGHPNSHQDCLNACLAGQAIAKLPEPVLLFTRRAVYAQVSIPTETPLLMRSGAPAFLARAPPMIA
ncbi:hypothetical protein BH10PSE10_BH10PSE10_19800 [soil metagenome]